LQEGKLNDNFKTAYTAANTVVLLHTYTHHAAKYPLSHTE
jgi:hypothetical protein